MLPDFANVTLYEHAASVVGQYFGWNRGIAVFPLGTLLEQVVGWTGQTGIFGLAADAPCNFFLLFKILFFLVARRRYIWCFDFFVPTSCPTWRGFCGLVSIVERLRSMIG